MAMLAICVSEISLPLISFVILPFTLGQHKLSNYFLYTSGCLNLTRTQFESIVEVTSAKDADRGGRGAETQLCEVSARDMAIKIWLTK